MLLHFYTYLVQTIDISQLKLSIREIRGIHDTHFFDNTGVSCCVSEAGMNEPNSNKSLKFNHCRLNPAHNKYNFL